MEIRLCFLELGVKIFIMFEKLQILYEEKGI